MARALAERLGIVMVNSGAMYRAVTWKILSENIDPTDTEAVIASLRAMEIVCSHDGTFSTITIDGTDPTPFIRNPEINANVSTVSAIPEVRDKLVGLQRDYLKETHVVMEGRDIGSIVFPDTPFKIYIDADPSVRHGRRSGDGEIDSVEKRDAADSSRTTAPLKVADGATKIDTSKLTIEGAIQAAIETLGKQGFPIREKKTPRLPEGETRGWMRWMYWLGWMSFGAAYRTLFGLRLNGMENLITSVPSSSHRTTRAFSIPRSSETSTGTRWFSSPAKAFSRACEMGLPAMERRPRRSGEAGHVLHENRHPEAQGRLARPRFPGRCTHPGW